MDRLIVLGQGQLAQLYAEMAAKTGVEITVVGQDPQWAALHSCDHHVVAPWGSEFALDDAASFGSVALLDTESIPAGVLFGLQMRGVRIFPSPEAIVRMQDKYWQREAMARRGLRVARFAAVRILQAIRDAGKEWGYPIFLKLRKGGYDGNSNVLIYNESEIETALTMLKVEPNAIRDGTLLVEKCVNFVMEVSVIVVGGIHQEQQLTYAPVQISREWPHVLAPAPLSADLAAQARALACSAVQALSAYGVAGVKLYLLPDGTWMVNEISPRVVNAGMHTVVSCWTSQFENAVRAALAMPLGFTDMIVPFAAMNNLVATSSDSIDLTGARAVRGAAVTDYLEGPRKDCRVAHVVAVGETAAEAIDIAEQAARAARLSEL